MGVHVVLDIVPQRIDPAAWAEAFDETARLLAAHPARLLGYGFRVAAGVRVPVFTRGVEQGGNDPAERRWCVVGDRATLGSGERQRMYRDLRRYTARIPPAPVASASATALAFLTAEPPADDVLALALSGVSRPAGRGTSAVTPVRVFGEGEQSTSCQLALLAAAMVVETRFPRDALVSGRFDREQAEAARRWASGVAGRAVALPVRVDAWRLVERLGAHLEGQALVRAVDALYLAESPAREAALLGVFGRTDAEPWFAGRLREHASPAEPGALRLAAAYLEATRDPARLLGFACIDPRGPRWTAEAFVAALASLRPRLDEGAIGHALGLVFGEGAARIEAAYRAASTRGGPVAETSPSTTVIEGLSAIDAMANATSPGELVAAQRERLLALAFMVRDVQRRVEDHGGPVSTGVALRTIATLLARGGPTLTDDAWDWIEREEDPEIGSFLAALVTLEAAEPEVAALRRVLLENRALCRYAAAASRDEGLAVVAVP
jgi:hypothetical protein